MTVHDSLELVRVIAVIALVVLAAAIATPKNRVPLALRGLLRILRKDGRASNQVSPAVPVATAKRLFAFLLVVLAAALALVNL